MLLFFNRFDNSIDFLIFAIAYLLVIILSLSLHEFAHAYVAYKNGDETPKFQGRITLNPLKHIDPLGILCCALFGFGWARPVEINPSNFRNIKRGVGWTSVAGVLMNLILAFFGYGFACLTALITVQNVFISFLQNFFYYLFIINLSLAVFNILPIYPLDGFKLVENYTKYNNGYVRFMYKYGNWILLAIVIFFDELLFSLISIISYPITWFWNLFF
ncbi:MAG: site-2 protease family protein [Christensenellales bacterium]